MYYGFVKIEQHNVGIRQMLASTEGFSIYLKNRWDNSTKRIENDSCKITYMDDVWYECVYNGTKNVPEKIIEAVEASYKEGHVEAFWFGAIKEKTVGSPLPTFTI